MYDLLRAHDGALIELECDDGAVIVSPTLQGRVFCRLGDELVHRLDAERLANPSPNEFNNLGGNSLWPAPEGGAFAFNYLPGDDRWLVQAGIAEQKADIFQKDSHSVVIEKRIRLTNRKGVLVDVDWRRAVSVASIPAADRCGLTGIAYSSEDTLIPLGAYRAEQVLLAPWSLEQFPGAEGVTAFCKVQSPSSAINFDFYGEPGERIRHGDGHFAFVLGGEDRHQIGVPVASHPELLGALDSNRSLLLLREAEPSDGVYFNIADNDQPSGPYSAADIYSVFNGGALNFFELETIGAMNVVKGRIGPSTLRSETTILRGGMEDLRKYLDEREGIRL